jgi:hypothetical protein
MASPHRSELFSHIRDRSTSPSIILVPTRDGDSYEVVLGRILTLVRSEKASSEQNCLLAIEPTELKSALIEAEPPYAPAPTDESGDATAPEFGDS